MKDMKLMKGRRAQMKTGRPHHRGHREHRGKLEGEARLRCLVGQREP
jgi:hypothetical protein